MAWAREIESDGVAATLRIGRALGAVLQPGDLVGLVGPLGAGKTHLVKGIAAGLEVADQRSVNSPTFVLVNEYDGRLHVFHLDAYRLGSGEELAALGFEEMCASGGVVLVEWADRVREALDENALWIELLPTGENQRRLLLRTEPGSLAARLEATALDRT